MWALAKTTALCTRKGCGLGSKSQHFLVQRVDYAGDHRKKSTSGTVQFLSHSLDSWSTKK